MSDFELHKYPYLYKCDCCGRQFKLSERKERSLKRNYDVVSDKPLFFGCLKCGSGLSKPIGYDGYESMIMFNLGFWDIIKIIFRRKKH